MVFSTRNRESRISSDVQSDLYAYLGGIVRAEGTHQAAHHRTRTFRDELLELLEKHCVEYDERYVLG